MRIDLDDLAGRVVRTLLDEERGAGIQSVDWDGRDGRGGLAPVKVRFGRMTAGDERCQVTLVRVR